MLMYKGFIGQIDYDLHTSKLVGEVVNALDLLEFDGESVIELKQNFEKTIDDYLQFQTLEGDGMPIPFIGNFTVCLPTDKQKLVIEEAHRSGQSVSHWLNTIVNRQLSQYFSHVNSTKSRLKR
jgi:predicted HicB family RNase H-like nuclease